MEADWEERNLIVHPGPAPHALPTPPELLAFDSSQELLWTGNQYGRVTSFYGPQLERYTSYKGHTSEPVKQILFNDKGVISVSARSVHLSIRRGLTQWHLVSAEFSELRCMSFTSKTQTEIVVAGMQDKMFKIDTEKGAIVEAIPAPAQFTKMKKGGSYICAATNEGVIHILDAATLRTVKTWQPHNGPINDMDAGNEYLITCGRSQRQQHGLLLDPLANVYSLKSLLQLAPIPFQPGAAFVRLHPKMSTTAILASQSGQLRVVDIHNPNTASLKQASIFEGTFLTTLELAPSGEALALADTMCQIHLWGSPTKMQFAEFSNPTIFADTPAPLPTMDWSVNTPLNTVGMPYYREVLFSAWPSHLVFEVGAPPPKIDPAILQTQQESDMGYFAKNPRTRLRNQAYTREVEQPKNGSLQAPKFLSEKAREAAAAPQQERRMSETLETMTDAMLSGTTKKNVPVMYRNVEIKYSKFGVDDFDFEYYNKTKFSGLETHIPNSYANPLLQLYRFIPIIRNTALQHTASACLYEQCMLCELGFLIDMLEKADGRNCQATNLLKTFSKLPNAAALNLLEEHTPNSTLTTMIQSVNRFLLDRFSADFHQAQPYNQSIKQLFSTRITATIRCNLCAHEQMKIEELYAHELVYPAKNMMRAGPRFSKPMFSLVLRQSVERQDAPRGWCPRCRRYQPMSSRKQLQSIPPVLMINSAINTAGNSTEAKQLWSQPGWLPREIGIIVQNSQFFCYEGPDVELQQRGVFNVQVYELVGVVADINSGENQKPHLVSLIDVGPSSSDPRASNQWHLFNDFLVRQTSQEDALKFDQTWKLPSVIAYQLKQHSHKIDESWKSRLDTTLLHRVLSTPKNRSPDHPDPTRLLAVHEKPKPGTLVGIDAEFVALQREEIEMKPDGKRETIRPTRLGLARVSVLRQSGVPFIDDYIAISEPVIDYVTAYSGIKPGDLDPATSPHALVSLKVAYKKLWLLLNLGVVFVGHGLLKDFRTINMHVPKAQVIDTVDLFYLPSRQRRIGLRFLASLLLSEEIQVETHDSIEDARTALRLLDKWREIENDDDAEATLEWIYKTGYEMDWGKAARPGEGRATPEPGSIPIRSAAGTPVRRMLGVGKASRESFGSPSKEK